MKYYSLLLILFILSSCRKSNSQESTDSAVKAKFYAPSEFVMGADLSYVNQILEHGYTYKDSGNIMDPYKIFHKYGANVIRFRLFHTPKWTMELYGPTATKMYNDYDDVKKGISESKAAGMQTCLDFHYSDTWADPGNQIKPATWDTITRINVLKDSLYNYTYKTLFKLGQSGLMPEFVQVGNEINPGLLLPQGDRWDGNESNMIILLNSAIKAVRDAGISNSIKPKVIIHIAQPENVDSWFDGLAAKGLVDYDIIGISYYNIWSNVALSDLNTIISRLKSKYGKEVIIMETSYPWTSVSPDGQTQIISASQLAPGYPATPEGQYKYLCDLTQKVIDGGGKGVFYWEPAWITDPWSKNAFFRCYTFFNYETEVIKGMQFMTLQYKF
jgi:arabinogalactan endo-1,4-beta-galactosidase